MKSVLRKQFVWMQLWFYNKNTKITVNNVIGGDGISFWLKLQSISFIQEWRCFSGPFWYTSVFFQLKHYQAINSNRYLLEIQILSELFHGVCGLGTSTHEKCGPNYLSNRDTLPSCSSYHSSTQTGSSTLPCCGFHCPGAWGPFLDGTIMKVTTQRPAWALREFHHSPMSNYFWLNFSFVVLFCNVFPKLEVAHVNI